MSLGKAKASPTKSFFVRMLTRDITLEDCILDLVDNSIDSAWQSVGPRPSELTRTDDLAQFNVDIEVGTERFRIHDNCGGMSFDDAVDYAFTFGREEEREQPDDYSVGVYGIGMKRAIFKIGNSIRVHSTHEKDGIVTSFVVPIDVEAWLRSIAWDFDIDEAPSLEAPGVEIGISDLAPETKASFKDPTYETKLKAVLSRDYMLPLLHGLSITVNGSPVARTAPQLRRSEAFEPMRANYDDDDVHVEMLAGMGFPPPDDVEPDEVSDAPLSGWYVFCNGRAVLTADTTAVTGWGVDLPRWHSQYNGFVGMILFSAVNPLSLPMTTTKRSVDVSSAVYLRARHKMIAAARDWVNYTNERKADLEAARARERSSGAVAVTDVQERPSLVLPRVRVQTAPPERIANINYARPLKEVRKLARAFGNARHTYRDVGIKSFEYAFEMLVDEDEG